MKRARNTFQTPFKADPCTTVLPEPQPTATAVHRGEVHVTRPSTVRYTSPTQTQTDVVAPATQGTHVGGAGLIEDILYWLDVGQRAATVLSEELDQPVETILAALSISPSFLLFVDGVFCTE